MFEVLIERPRGGAGWGRPWPRVPWAQLDRSDDGVVDGGPSRLRMGPRRRSKWLSENLAPLRRFLVRQVGRPWNDVYAEICANISPRSTVQKHVLDHLKHYVELLPVFIDGWPHHPTAFGSGRAGGYQPLGERGRSFYVCPETGRLLLPRRPPCAHRVLPLSPLRELRQIAGQWYLVQLAPLPQDYRELARCYDVLLKRRLDRYELRGPSGLLVRTYGRGDVFAVAMEQPRAQLIPSLVRQGERYAAELT